MRVTRMLYAVAAVLAVVGLVLRFAPPRTGAGRHTGVQDTRVDSAAVKAPLETPGTGALIVGGNIFSVSRSAPRVRYLPSDLSPSRPAARQAGPRSGPGLKLVGTISGTAALIDADPAVRGAEIYRIGDLVRGKRIAAVSESTVVLDGPAGRTILRLPPSPQPTP
jgi:hypothetical protein